MEAPRLEHPEAQKHQPAPKTANLAAVENVPAAPAPTPLVTEAPKRPKRKARLRSFDWRLSHPPLCPSSNPRHRHQWRRRCASLLRRKSRQRANNSPTRRPPRSRPTQPRTSAMLATNAPLRPNFDAHPFGIEDYDEVDYSPRSRVVERWTEREYLLPSRESSERRRVIIIRPEGQHPFGSIFGSLR